jgi:signal transduction histidine kinase
MLALLKELASRVRSLSTDLRPPMLDDVGLVPALLHLFERCAATTRLQVNFRHTGVGRRFAPELETAVYRIAQEALTNVARHAGVQDVDVRLSADAAMLRLSIEDRGAGFDVQRVLERSAAGLSGMRERARLLSGRLTIDAAPLAGTRLLLELPLAAALRGDSG